MKLLNRKQFLKMPAYTIFSYWNEKYFMDLGEINIKGCEPGDYTSDFVCQSITELGFEFSDDGMDNQYIAEEKLQKGESISIDEDCYGRDGCFDDDQKFLIFEKEDIQKMINNLQKGLGL